VLAWYTVSVRHELYQAEQRQSRNGADEVARLLPPSPASTWARRCSDHVSRPIFMDDSANPAAQLRCV